MFTGVDTLHCVLGTNNIFKVTMLAIIVSPEVHLSAREHLVKWCI
jgi:hypothetical protein